MNNKPLVSVVMITYAHEHTIIKAIEGVFLQNANFNIELIIANDCSPDRTDELVKEFLANANIPKNIEVRYTNHASNLGMMGNVIFSIKQVQGKYIAPCEGDDYWTDPLKLQKQVDFLEANHDYGLVHTNYQIYFAKNNKFEQHKPQPNVSRADENEYFLRTGDIRTCTALFRTSFLPKFKDLMDQDFMQETVIGDRPFFLVISKYAKIKFINEVTSVYYVTAFTSASHFEDFFRYYEFLKKVSETNIKLMNFLHLGDLEYIKDQQRKISFYEVLLSFKTKEYSKSLGKIFSKTGKHFWNKKELLEVYGILRRI